jgi:hypothetical protein
MAQRVIGIAAAVTGLFFVMALLLLRVDLRGAARKGPKWKRNLILAGLLVLAAAGVVAVADIPGRLGRNNGVPAESAGTIGEALEWRRLERLMNEAAQITAGQRGWYPFNEVEKAGLVSTLRLARRDADILFAAGFISRVEADLIKEDLETLRENVQAMLPVEDRMTSCYAQGGFRPAEPMPASVTKRVALLEKLANSEQLQPQVIEKVLVVLEKDISSIETREPYFFESEILHKQALDTCRKGRALIGEIKNSLTGAHTNPVK